MESKYLRCPQCESSLKSIDSGYVCVQCDAEFGVSHGVPILISGISSMPSNFELSDELIDQILVRESIPDESANREELHDIFSKNYQLQEFLLTAENNFYLKRTGLKVDGYRKPLESKEVSRSGVVSYELKFHMIPDILPPGELRSWIVRLENTGERTFLRDDGAPYFLTYQWRSKEGELLPAEAERTRLPVDIVAGRGITIPLWINPPPDVGQYVLEVFLDQRGKDWTLPKMGLTLNLAVDPHWVSMVPQNWLTLHRLPGTYDYQIDHEIGKVFLKEELALGGHAYERVLEVGGCSNPMTWDLPCQVVIADIDVQTLQVGALRFPKTRPNIEFFAADAHKLPFVDGTFDCAVMFATLHHFLDPSACLKELSRVVKPDGFVAILCEPIGSYRAETLSEEFKADLEEGINEQIFTPEEYGQIFSTAGLATSRAMIDGGSFKAILRRVKRDELISPAGAQVLVAPAAPGTAPKKGWLKKLVRRIARL